MHEVGHALTASVIGMDIIVVYIWPGFEFFFTWEDNNIYPNMSMQIIENTHSKLAYTGYTPSADSDFTPFKNSIIGVMGSGFNYLISIIALVCVYKFKPTGFLFILGICCSLFFYDLFLYSVLPTIFNLPHLFFWGGKTPEPIDALIEFGIHRNYSIGLVIALSTIQIIYLYRLKNLYNKNTR